VDGDAAIRRVDRLAPPRPLRGQIALGEEAASLARPAGHLAGGLALVEPGAPGAQPLEGAREIRVEEAPADRGARSLGEEDARGGRIGREDWGGALDPLREPPGDREPVARVAHRGGQVVGERQPAMARVRLAPAIHRARHRDGGGHDAAERDLAEAARAEPLDRGGRGRRARRVERVHRAGARVVNQPERVAAHAGHVRVDHREHRGRRDRRVDRGAARLQDLDAGLGGQRVRRGDHAAVRQRGRTPGIEDAPSSAPTRAAAPSRRPRAGCGCSRRSPGSRSGGRAAPRPRADARCRGAG